MRHALLARFAPCLVAWLTPLPAKAAPEVVSPEATVSLAAWGLGSVDELAYARVGLLDTTPPRLIVYHLGKVDPALAAQSEKRAPPPLSGGSFLLAPLDGENRNGLGGFFSAFAHAPARAEATFEDSGDGTLALAFSFHKSPGTFAGFWIHLFDSRRAPSERLYLDARGVAWLTFEVRGDLGGEPVRLQLADRAWEKRQDSSPIDDVGALLEGGTGRIDTTWRRVWLPLDRLDQPKSRLDRSRLASVVFLVDPEGQGFQSGRIWVRGLALTTERVAPPPPARPRTIARHSEQKAMWLWETRRILDSAAELARLVAFCRAQALTDVFVQIPYLEPRLAHQWSPRWDAAGLKRIVLALAPARVHALDGAPFYAQPEWHARLVTTVGQVAAYNRKSPPPERLAGIRFDVEPYLLAAWQGQRREAVLKDYLALLEKLAAEAHAGGLPFGVDLPFWFDGRDELTGELAAPLEGPPVIGRVIELADNLGLMDYRTTAFGADGVLAHGMDELALASALGKTVFIGLETGPLPDECLLTFSGPWSPDDASLVSGAGPRLAGGDGLGSGEVLVLRPLGAGVAGLSLVPTHAVAPTHARVLGLRDAIRVPADKITFAKRGRAALEATMARARPELATSPSFLGFALHAYESLWPWYAAP